MATIIATHTVAGRPATSAEIGDPDASVFTSWRCSEDGSVVYASAGSHGQQMRCERGHCWQQTVVEFDNASRGGLGHGWRQVA